MRTMGVDYRIKAHLHKADSVVLLLPADDLVDAV